VPHVVEGQETSDKLRLEARDVHLVGIALDTLMNGVSIFVVPDADDATMSVFDEMAGSFFGASAVFDQDAIGVGAGKWPVEGDDGKPGAL